MSKAKYMKISEFCDTGSGTTPSRQKSELYYGGSIPWIKSGELRESLITECEEKVTELALKETSLKIVPSGALLVAMYGATVGRIGRLGIEATTNQAVCHILPDPKIADNQYMFYALQNKTSEFVSKGVGGAQPNISQGTIKDTSIYLPPLEEQKRIAAILDQADALRRQRQRALNRLNQLGQSIFYEMFGDPKTNPKGFDPANLGEIINFIGGSQPAKTHFLYDDGPNRVRFVQIRDFRTDDYKTYVPKHLAKRPFAEEDVMIGRYGPPVFQIFRGLSGTYNVALMKAEPKSGITKDFVFYLLQEKTLHSHVVANSERTAGQSGVNLELLEAYPAYRPPLALQMQFSDRIKQLNENYGAAQNSSTIFNSLFSSLQQRAFRGEL